MRLICPHCQRSIEVGDDRAGQELDCPLCDNRFAAPSLYGGGAAGAPPEPPPAEPEPDPEAMNFGQASPPPPVEPEPPAAPELALPDSPPAATELAVPEPPAAPTKPPGARREYAVSLPLHAVRWGGFAFLTVAFLTTPFPWFGLYPNGISAYTQSPWQGLFGDYSREPFANNALKMNGVFDESVGSDWLMFLYLPLLLAGVVAAGVARIVPLFSAGVPSRLKTVWPYLRLAVTVIAGLTLLLLLLQLAVGFGLETALEEYAAKTDFAGRPIDESFTSEEQQLRTARTVASYSPGGSTCLTVAVWAHLLAAASIGLELALRLRGQDRQPPRVAVSW